MVKREALLGSAIVASTLANIHIPKHKKKVTPENFLPPLEYNRRESTSAEIVAMFAANCKVEFKNGPSKTHR